MADPVDLDGDGDLLGPPHAAVVGHDEQNVVVRLLIRQRLSVTDGTCERNSEAVLAHRRLNT